MRASLGKNFDRMFPVLLSLLVHAGLLCLAASVLSRPAASRPVERGDVFLSLGSGATTAGWTQRAPESGQPLPRAGDPREAVWYQNPPQEITEAGDGSGWAQPAAAGAPDWPDSGGGAAGPIGLGGESGIPSGSGRGRLRGLLAGSGDSGGRASPAPSGAAQAGSGGSGITRAAYGSGFGQVPYPPESKRRGEQGTVVLAVRILADGSAQEVQIVTSSGFARLDGAALQAVRQARFVPQLVDGRPGDSTEELRVRFVLVDGPAPD